MTTLLEISSDIWLAIQHAINEAQRDGPLARLKEFVPRKRIRSAQQAGPGLYVLSRSTQVIEWGANRGIAELTVQFGVTHTTLRPEDVSPELEELVFALIGLLMRRPTLGGADDMRVNFINPDDDPFGPEDTVPWATTTITWGFQFLQPEGF